MSLVHSKLIKGEKLYLRKRDIQSHNPLYQEPISEICPLCKHRGKKRKYETLNKLYGHFYTHHRITRGIFESTEEFKVRKNQAFDYKQYVLKIADKLLEN